MEQVSLNQSGCFSSMFVLKNTFEKYLSCVVQIFITVLGIVQLARGRASTSLTQPLFEDSSTSPSKYALAFYSGLWAFDGWDQANFVGGEMKNPETNMPRAIHSSMGIVTVSRLLCSADFG